MNFQKAYVPTPGTTKRDLLRVLTCGSVDDGKSTLIGRLIHDLGLVPEDEMRALEKASLQAGMGRGELDFAMLLDGLEDERAQGITIDVAYRYFGSKRRNFIVADAPGHEQYTRNMATGASVSDLAIILIDARKGLLSQTRRHSLIASLFGIRNVVVVVNKVDLVDYSQDVFSRISEQYRAFSAELKFDSIIVVPVCARGGENVVSRSKNMPWYDGPVLLDVLETAGVDAGNVDDLRLQVQMVCRPNSEFRGYAGTVTGGRLRRGSEIVAAASGRRTQVTQILVGEDERDEVTTGTAVMVTLADEIDISRGDVLCSPTSRPEIVDQLAAHLLWLGDEPLLPGRSYFMKLGTRTVPATVTSLKHRIDINTGGFAAARTLAVNEIGFCNFGLSSAIAVDPFAVNRHSGGFIMIDRITGATVGAGMVSFGLRRARNIYPHADKTKDKRIGLKGHRPAVLWLTGLSGAGKSTIAALVEKQLNERSVHTFLMDGDNMRTGLNRDLGFTEADRVENVRRVTEVAKLFVDAGVIVIVSLISPFRSERTAARERIRPDEFVELHVDAPIDVCIERDPKGLYAKATRGELINFTGIDSPYEQPESPDLRLDTVNKSPETLAREIIAHLVQTGVIP